MTRKRSILAVVSAAAAVIAVRRRHASRRAVGRAAARSKALARRGAGRSKGFWYRVRRRHPDEDVVDLVLADRIRSTLGPLERKLDLPHVHVMVHGHTAVLHGDVATESDLDAIEDAVLDVAGVHAVRSRLHVGLLPGDTRPSEGRAVRQPSSARLALEEAARRGGAAEPPERALRAVLATFLGRIPEHERDQVLTHLPSDVRELVEPLHDTSTERAAMRTTDQLLDAVDAADPSVDGRHVRVLTETVLGELAALVPEERADIAAVLPHDLEQLWRQATATATR